MALPLNHPAADRWSVSALSRAFDIDRATCTKRLRQGSAAPCGTDAGNPVYRLRDVAHLLSPVTTDAFAGEFNPDNLTPKERKDWYEGTKAKVALERDQGLLIPLHEYETRLATVYKALSALLETLGDTLEREAGLPAAAVDRVNTIIDDFRHTMADRMANLAGEDDERRVA